MYILALIMDPHAFFVFCNSIDIVRYIKKPNSSYYRNALLLFCKKNLKKKFNLKW